MHLYWTTLSHQEEGTLSSSLYLPSIKQVFELTFYNSHMGRTFSSLLGSSQMFSEVTTHPWI